MNVAIYGRKITKQSLPHFKEIIDTIDSFGWNLILEKELKNQLVDKLGVSTKIDEFESYRDFYKGIDLTLSIGGDGTFIKKKYDFQKRSLLRVQTEEELFGEDNFALNEVTFHKKDTASMITVHASLDDKYLNSYWADGLIVATPTGSTAYSLSCGGPIITPGCQVHILTPIAPHNLNVRPMVVPDHLPIKLSIEGRDRRYLISRDGNSKSIRQGEEVMISKAEFMINVVKFEDNNFLDTIRNKMLWGIDRRN